MATRTAAPGLSTDELGRIRDTLATGRKPKVVFTATAGQIAGQVGQVVGLTDPDLSDEWVVVRFGHDELPFSPADLEMPSRTRQSSRAARPAAATAAATGSAAASPPLSAPASPVSAPQFRAASLPGPREEPSVPSATSTPVNGAGRAAKKPPAAPGRPAAAGDNPPATVDGQAKATGTQPPSPAAQPAGEATVAARGDDRPKPARKPTRPKAPASLTVTLTYSEGEWMVGAMQGSKALAKPYVIKPSEAMKMVGMIDVPGVHEAVEEIVSAARTEAEMQAEKLRAELAEIESKLAELREAG